jgi:hypothetical protein
MNSGKKAKQRKALQKAKKEIKTEPAYLEICKEYDVDPDVIDDIRVSFEPLDVSAKTVNGVVFLNDRLFDVGDMDDIKRYLIHETVHVFQQEAGKVDGQVDKDDYLDDKNEQESFQVQLEFMDDHSTKEEIQEYLEQLLDHHEIKGKERKQKIRELTKKI